MQERSTLHHQLFNGIQTAAFLYTILVSLVAIPFAKNGIQFTYSKHFATFFGNTINFKLYVLKKQGKCQGKTSVK
jgi:hypothetical protein